MAVALPTVPLIEYASQRIFGLAGLLTFLGITSVTTTVTIVLAITQIVVLTASF